jgi:hypothetical protein
MPTDPELIKEIIYKDDGRYLIYYSLATKNDSENKGEIDNHVRT